MRFILLYQINFINLTIDKLKNLKVILKYKLLNNITITLSLTLLFRKEDLFN